MFLHKKIIIKKECRKIACIQPHPVAFGKSLLRGRAENARILLCDFLATYGQRCVKIWVFNFAAIKTSDVILFTCHRITEISKILKHVTFLLIKTHLSQSISLSLFTKICNFNEPYEMLF